MKRYPFEVHNRLFFRILAAFPARAILAVMQAGAVCPQQLLCRIFALSSPDHLRSLLAAKKPPLST